MLSRFLIALICCLGLLPGFALAAGTGTLRVTATDEAGLPLPGVVVTLRSEALSDPRIAEADAGGDLLFLELPQGVYAINASAPGFEPRERQGVIVMRELSVTVWMELPPTEKGEELLASRSGSVLTKDFLDRIPAGRSYQSAVQMAAGVTGSSRGRTDPCTGMNRSSGDRQQPLQIVPCKDIEIPVFPFDPEYSELVEPVSTRLFPFQCAQPAPHRYHRH